MGTAAEPCSNAPADTAPFKEQAQLALVRVKGAFAEAIDALPRRISRPHELAKCLSIDTKLAWKISRLTQSTDPFTVVEHLPGSAAIRAFLMAAAGQNVPPERIAAVESAVKELEQVIEVHAGDRVTLEMMSLSFATAGRQRAELNHRKAAFTANSYIWGVQARTQLKTAIVYPSADHRRVDVASVRGFVALRRIRANIPWVIGRARFTDDQGNVLLPAAQEPLDPVEDDPEGRDGAPLLRAFCSKPLPQMRRVSRPHGYLEDELVPGEVGTTGAVTCIAGEVKHALAPYYRTEQDSTATLVVQMRTPCKVLLFDLFVHEDLFGSISPELAIYSELEGRAPFPMEGRERDQLAMSASVEHLGKGPSVVHTTHVPRYAEMIRYVLDRLGWDGQRLNVYRVEIQYPVIPTLVALAYPLPEAPAE